MSGHAAAPGLDVARLVKDHQQAIWRYLRVLGCPQAQADDLTQETFLAVLQKPFHEYSKAATGAYLRKVAHNLFITSQRRAARSVVVGQLDGIDAVWNRWIGEHDDGTEVLSALEKCLQKLSERAQLALKLRYRDRRSRLEIASALNLSQDGAKNLLQRAKQRLRDCIELSVSRI